MMGLPGGLAPLAPSPFRRSSVGDTCTVILCSNPEGTHRIVSLPIPAPYDLKTPLFPSAWWVGEGRQPGLDLTQLWGLHMLVDKIQLRTGVEWRE